MMGNRTPEDDERPAEPALEPETLPGSLRWRLAAVRTLLDRACVAYTAVRAAGKEHEIAVVEAPSTEVTALASLARDIRVLGFRFVTLDLAPAGRAPRPAACGPQ